MSQPSLTRKPKPARGVRRKSCPDPYFAVETAGPAPDLQDQVQIGLHEEAALLRAAIRRTFSLARDVENLDEMIKVLRAVSGAAGRLASLLRAQSALPTSQGEAWRELLAGIADETLAELRRQAAQHRPVE